MKILMINVVCGIRSTGKICAEMAEKLSAEGHEVKIAYGREMVPEKYQKYAVKIGDSWDQKLHGIRTRVMDEHGFGSKRATKKFLEWAEDYNPDLVWLHNIHGYYVNVEMLFGWIKKRTRMQVKWTLHDCWAFTGHCSHFTVAQCEQWKTQCRKCVEKKRYPASLVKDNCKNNFKRKKQAFTGVKNMTLITPSRWLADLVKQSFLAEYPVEVCRNKIDTNIFKPTYGEFRKKYNLEDKKIVLGVASAWDKRKGLEDFAKLVNSLNDSYAVVLVGLTKDQIAQMPRMVEEAGAAVKVQETEGGNEATVVRTTKGVAVPWGAWNLLKEIGPVPEDIGGKAELICISRTNNSNELAEIYTAADYFVNPTYEDTYPTVNLEAIACGTRVITYLTGGSPETLADIVT